VVVAKTHRYGDPCPVNTFVAKRSDLPGRNHDELALEPSNFDETDTDSHHGLDRASDVYEIADVDDVVEEQEKTADHVFD
jgi:hypothetical protein